MVAPRSTPGDVSTRKTGSDKSMAHFQRTVRFDHKKSNCHAKNTTPDKSVKFKSEWSCRPAKECQRLKMSMASQQLN